VTLVIVSVEPLPDLDSRIKPILDDRFGITIEHRGPTHSLTFAGAIGLVIGAIGLVPGYPIVLGAAALCSILGHLAGDVITPMGVRPLWPTCPIRSPSSDLHRCYHTDGRPPVVAAPR
jgi:inner membrane protein